ncbi:hypothetical protein EYC84_002795 [Monilinia fructicola]|uniref:Uncharacterized protein n=1 Tax=Monilinia fructicola TaxID=38448 RepID=A0A5M9JM06_MONFR|nr:hypothetical protein EYC84_002795 [Monilinia fructicola]
MDHIEEGSNEQDLIDLCLQVFCSPSRTTIPSTTESSLDSSDCTSRILSQCGSSVINLLSNLSRSIRAHTGNHKLTLQRLDDMLALAKEKFYAYPFKDVPECWRALYLEASLLKFSTLASRKPSSTKDKGDTPLELDITCDKAMDQMVETMDMALIMVGAPASEPLRLAIDYAMHLLQKIHAESLHENPSTSTPPPPKRRKRSPVHSSSAAPPMYQDRFSTSLIPPPPF